jgi:hypothetical protein
VISEPELSDGSDDPRPVDIVGGFDPADRGFGPGFGPGFGAGGGPGGDLDGDPGDGFGDREGRVPARVRPPWVWVLGAVVVTSAVWAGGMYAYDRGHVDTPALHGYRMNESPCTGSAFMALFAAVGATEGQGSPAVLHRGPALDQMRCDYSLDAPYAQGGTTTYNVGVSIDLHTKTDPSAEFGDQARLEGGSITPAGAVVSVPGLGDEAYFLTGGNQGQELKVRHGGAVFDLVLSASSDINVSDDTLNALGGGPYPLSPELTQYQPELIETVRAMMSALRQR